MSTIITNIFGKRGPSLFWGFVIFLLGRIIYHALCPRRPPLPTKDAVYAVLAAQKELKKDEKANVKDNLGKKEEGTAKPKGVKVMPDKGVTGSEKTIKEGFDGKKVDDMIKSGKIKPEEVKAAAEKAMKGDSTSLIALMAGLKLSEDTVEEGKANKYWYRA